ncbi:MAG: cytochrome C oxidase Cbb3 [Rhodospirillaceae bacterium]|nr:cytochrome C oxidase Cbb3 [Rhodospirillaceae bacterium]MBT5243475.1 cytochrome C oxidase Cbb3 [Rhodospirillaceae bacterium]MBT5562063.1 cytochrome C oxidase Cbb3 [Rhodospirillaceae bacterium]MBT6242236.1 cytochrome C oxidase Cbb3 [Rhodospirillaceae bacterium]MBT7136268.1 cytochrome C oxidase Cbb3 [Rhodospirillaceae bacterium]
MRFLISIVAALLIGGLVVARAETPDTAALYAEHCAECHGADRLGGMGTPLLPENLGRLPKDKAIEVIADGRPAVQMPAYEGSLDDAEIKALVDFIYTPLDAIPQWKLPEMNASHIIHNDPAGLPETPKHNADPLNLFTVVETGDHHVSILDGDSFETLWRFKSRFALHGGAKYSPDGRFVYLASRDGWVSKYDLFSFKTVAEIRIGINTRNIAVSGDGRWVAAGNTLPHTLVIMDSETLKPVKIIPVIGKDGTPSRVSAVYTAPPRNSFIAALKDIPEIWEMSYEDDPEPVPQGLIHNYQPGMEEGAFDYGPFPVRRIILDDYLDDFFFDQSYVNLIGAARNGKNGQVVNMRVGRKIADLDLSGMPHLGSGITFEYEGRPVMATPHLKDAVISVIDLKSWKTIKRIETKGPGFFMRSHDNTPYAWTDVFFGPNKDLLHIIDKRTLEIVKTLKPAPGKTGAHVEFTRDGKFALVSVWDMDGALVIYDAETFKEVKRIKMVKPSGKYNVFNKITYSSGTSH